MMEQYMGDVGVLFASVLVFLYMSWNSLFPE